MQLVLLPSRVAKVFVSLLLACAAWCFFLLALSAQESQYPTTGSNAQKYALSGTVVNAVTGEPIRRALVQINLNSERSVLSDATGGFQFDGLPPGQTMVIAHKPGFFNDQELAMEGPSQTRIQIGPEMQTVVVRLTPESVIFGQVASIDGDPIESMPVRVFSPRIVDGRKRWEQRGYSATDDDGHFRIAGLPPGPYYVAAGPGESRERRRFRGTAATDEGYPSVFHPGVTEISAATPIAVSAGQQVEADFSLRPQPLFAVTGTVAGVPPGTGVGIQFMNKAGEFLSVPIQFHRQTGEFQAKVPAGTYMVHANGFVPRQELNDGGNGQSLRASAPLVVTQDVANMHLTLGPAPSIPVEVRTDGTSAQRSPGTVSTRVITGSPEDGERFGGGMPLATVHLSAGENLLGNSEYWSSPVDNNRKNSPMAVRDVEPGRYWVDIIPNSPRWYVQSATCGSVNLLQDELTVVATAQLPPIEVVLRDDGGALSGHVESEGKPASGTVLLVPDHASPSRVKLAIAGEGGDFQFGQVAPGSYRVIAFDSAEKLEYRNPAVLDEYLSRGTAVTVQGNDQVRTKVELVRLGS